MTVSSTTSRWEYTGDGTTTDFTYNNLIFADGDLDVYVDGSLQTLSTDYTVTGAGTASGGEVKFTSAPADEAEIVIIRDAANTQGSDYPSGGPLSSSTLESDLDRRTVIAQDQQKKIDRSLKFPNTEQSAPSADLPAVSSRSDKYLGFDSGGALTVLAGTSETAGAVRSVSSMKGLVDATQSGRVLLRDFYSDTDGGGGHFRWDGDRAKSSANGGTIIDPDNVGTLSATSLGTFLSQQGTGSGTGCWVRLNASLPGASGLLGFVTPQMFGGKGDGSFDNTTVFDTAISYLDADATYGGVFYLPGGDYKFSSLDLTGTSSKELIIQGQNRKDTTLHYTSTTGTVIDLTNTRFITFKDLNLLPTNQKTAGAFFLIDNGDDLNFENLRFSSSNDGFQIQNGASNIELTNIEFIDFQSHVWNWAVRLIGSVSAIKMTDCLLQSSQSVTGGFVSVESSGGSGVDTLRMFRCSAQKQSTGSIPEGLVVEAGEFIHAINCNFETGQAAGIGVKIEGGSNIHLLDCHTTTSKNGVWITGGDGIQIIGGRSYFNNEEGINIDGGSDISIKNHHCFDNGRDAANTHDGINVAAAATDVSIVGTKVGTVRGDTVTMRYGIRFEDGVGGNVVCVGNDVDDAVQGTGAIYSTWGIASSLTPHVIQGNAQEPHESLTTHARARVGSSTNATLWSYTLNDNEHLLVRATVIAQGTSGTPTAGIVVDALVYRDGGSAVLEGSATQQFKQGWNASADASIDVNSNDVRVRALNGTGTTLDYSCNVQILGKVSAG